jgi:hypothetical protein
MPACREFRCYYELGSATAIRSLSGEFSSKAVGSILENDDWRRRPTKQYFPFYAAIISLNSVKRQGIYGIELNLLKNESIIWRG